MSRRTAARALASVVAVALLGACAHASPGQPDASVTICGSAVHVGAGAKLPVALDPVASPQPAPTSAELPAPAPTGVEPHLLTFVRTSTDCSTGAIITVVPVANARVADVFRAKDGNAAGVALLVIAPVVVSAWVSGHEIGSVSLEPLQSGLASLLPSATR